MKPARGRNHLRTGPEKKMVRVSEDHLRLELDEVTRLKGLDGAQSADIHENGSVDDAVRRSQAPEPRIGAIVPLQYLESHLWNYSIFRRDAALVFLTVL